jgi:hypothetical protein
MLGACMLVLPPSYVLESARVGTKGDLAKLPVLLALLYFGVVMPVGVLLPAWLAGEPDGTLIPGSCMAPDVLVWCGRGGEAQRLRAMCNQIKKLTMHLEMYDLFGACRALQYHTGAHCEPLSTSFCSDSSIITTHPPVCLMPTGTGKSVFLSFMISPITLCLIAATAFTAMNNPRLPFYLVDALVTDPSKSVDLAYAGTMIVLPTAVLLPIYFDGGMENTPKLITLCYMCILVGLLLLMFTISLCLGAAPDVREDAAVRNLPYAARTDVSKTASMMQTPNSQRTALSLQSLSQSSVNIHNYNGGKTSTTAVSGPTAFSDKNLDGHGTTNRMDKHFDGDDDDDDDEQARDGLGSTHLASAGGGNTELFRRESTKSAMWPGWEVGVACMAEFPPDGTVHSAHIVSLDWDHGRAVVSYDGYDGDDAQVPISRLYDARTHVEGNAAVSNS